jgi:hypothetical protein
MINQSTMKLALVLTLAVSTIMSGLLTLQTMWVFAQGNASQGTNQTGNQTGNQSSSANQSSSPATQGQPGYTPPG